MKTLVSVAEMQVAAAGVRGAGRSSVVKGGFPGEAETTHLAAEVREQWLTPQKAGLARSSTRP